MTRILVLGDEVKWSGTENEFDRQLEIKTDGNDKNLFLQIDAFQTPLYSDLPPRVIDLIYIAAYVYSADTKISRGGQKDVFETNWTRTFHFKIPVFDIEFWGTIESNRMLCDALEFVSGDVYTFEFVRRAAREVQPSLFSYSDPNDSNSIDVAICFSGGADSLAATLLALREERRPVLVSHRSAPVVNKRQKNLVGELRKRVSDWHFPHSSMWIHRKGGERGEENTQRTRSFLYAALAAATASGLGLDEIWLCDNGVVSINLPQSGQNWGTLLSRSTHPRTIELYQTLLRRVLDSQSLKLLNRLVFTTKPEVMMLIADSGHPELIQEAVSCAHVEGLTKLQPHCGVCSQCIDRRFATTGSGLTNYDLPNRYAKDIFSDELGKGIDRTHVENYVRFAKRLEEVNSTDSLFVEFPELFDALPSTLNQSQAAEKISDLFERHQINVNGVLEKLIVKESTKIRRGAFSPDTLVGMVASGVMNDDPCAKFAIRLGTLIGNGLPPAFQTVKATNERHVQDICQGLFVTALDSLSRETPQLPFGSVSTKPDFSKPFNGSKPLFIEFKFLRNRTGLNKMVTEITSRITIYRDQGAAVLFVVYDPSRVIVDDADFMASIVRNDVYLKIAR